MDRTSLWVSYTARIILYFGLTVCTENQCQYTETLIGNWGRKHQGLHTIGSKKYSYSLYEREKNKYYYFYYNVEN